MREEKTQITALVEALQKAGVAATPDFAEGLITLDALPEFREALAFRLAIIMDNPQSASFDGLFDGCVLESGGMVRGAVRNSGIYSRKTRVERAKQEKWAATWILYDAGIIPPEEKPVWESWQDVTLP